jgi:hypothetical protein
MIKIPLGKLELARVNPSLIALSIHSNDKKSGGNSGFVGSWKTIVRSYHENKESPSLSLNKLSEKLLIGFKSTKENIHRTAMFCNSFSSYCDEFKKLGLGIDNFQISIKWEILKESILTG